jgi:hypothetical protein
MFFLGGLTKRIRTLLADFAIVVPTPVIKPNITTLSVLRHLFFS